MLTLREIFDKVSNHLLTQNESATDESGACAYRMERYNDANVVVRVLKCAVGCLISDETYSPTIENMSVGIKQYLRGIDTETARKEAKLMYILRDNNVDLLDPTTRDLLYYLQRMHDAEPPSAWPSMLEDIRIRYNL